MSDERPESLAAQAAAWVPPWEREQRPPDRAYQAHLTDDERPSDDEDRSGAGLSDDDDDFDESFEGTNPPGYVGTVPPELPPIPGEADGPVSVDAPQELDDEPEREPTDVGPGPELPMPDSIEQAAGDAGDDTEGSPVDAPFPPEGDDAGDVFDLAADDDVSDDDEVDLPFTEDVPDDDTDADPPSDPDAGADAHSLPHPHTDAGAGGSEEEAADAAYVAGAADFEEAFRAGAAGAGLIAPDPAGPGAAGSGPAGPGAAGSGPAGPGAAGSGAAGSDPAGSGPAGGAAGEDVPPADPGEGPTSRVPTQARGKRRAAVAVEDAPARTEEGVDLAPLDDAEMAAALEAILLVVDEPVAEMQLAQILEQPAERVAVVLEDISARYTAAGHGFDLRRAAGGWRLYTRPEYAAYVERFVLDGQSVRLTQAALETLAVVAYKQPVTRSRISAIRGVNCDGVMRTLVTRGLIEECGTEGETGAYLYRTTVLFLEKLGLNSVDQLPPLAPFLPDDVEEVLDASG